MRPMNPIDDLFRRLRAERRPAFMPFVTAGDPDLHLAFSSLYLSRATIGAFGDVIRAIGTACPDPLLRFWTFIRYASVNHPDLLGVDLPAEKAAECDAILEKANPPAVTISAAERKKFQRDEEPAE